MALGPLLAGGRRVAVGAAHPRGWGLGREPEPLADGPVCHAARSAEKSGGANRSVVDNVSGPLIIPTDRKHVMTLLTDVLDTAALVAAQMGSTHLDILPVL
jgi:hypothetical protein